MSDRFPGEIWIGGKVTRPVLKGLIEALAQDGASHEYGDKAIESDCTDWDDLAPYLNDESLLNLKDDQAHNGELQITEQFCKDHGITFDRNSDHYCEYDAENVYWRPGMDRPMVMFSDSCGNEKVDGKEVREALHLVEKFQSCNHSLDDPDDWANLAEGILILNELCPKQPPNLESFEII